MKKYLEGLPREIKDLIPLMQAVALDKKVSVYLVGGFVRDIILKVPNLDLDVVVEGDGISFAQELARILKAMIVLHQRFGTATIVKNPSLKIDIASARKESYPQSACLPSIERSSLKDDHFRRDFTINAMAISINPNDFARLIDPFGGEQDLMGRKIRILHTLSFNDDPTRILRAIRFEQRYDFRIDSKTLGHLKEAVKLGMLEKINPHRLRDEITMIFKEKYPLKQLRRMNDLVGFGFINPCLKVSEKTYSLFSMIEREIIRFKKIFLSRYPIEDWLIYFMGLIEPLGADRAAEICAKFAFSKEESRKINCLWQVNQSFINGLKRKDMKPAQIIAGFSPLSYEAIILLRSKYKNRCLRKHIDDFLGVYQKIRLYVGGKDILKLGIAPGPVYQKILAKVMEARLNGLIRTRHEEIRLIKNITKEMELDKNGKGR
jgi:tRNA nucleotidyltransferase (CCA-adding enzyme)